MESSSYGKVFEIRLRSPKLLSLEGAKAGSPVITKTMSKVVKASYGGRGPLADIHWHVYILKCSDGNFIEATQRVLPKGAPLAEAPFARRSEGGLISYYENNVQGG